MRKIENLKRRERISKITTRFKAIQTHVGKKPQATAFFGAQ